MRDIKSDRENLLSVSVHGCLKALPDVLIVFVAKNNKCLKHFKLFYIAMYS